MAKRYYFSKSDSTGEFYLDIGSYCSNRESFGRDEDFILDKLKKIDLKRNSEFYLESFSFEKVFIRKIQKHFSGSKVKVKLEDKFD